MNIIHSQGVCLLRTYTNGQTGYLLPGEMFSSMCVHHDSNWRSRARNNVTKSLVQRISVNPPCVNTNDWSIAHTMHTVPVCASMTDSMWNHCAFLNNRMCIFTRVGTRARTRRRRRVTSQRQRTLRQPAVREDGWLEPRPHDVNSTRVRESDRLHVLSATSVYKCGF